MVNAFYLDPHLRLLVDVEDLLERLVNLVNEFLCVYVERVKLPLVAINREDYCKKLVPKVNKLLDIRVPEQYRKLVVAVIDKDSDSGDYILKVMIDESNASFLPFTPFRPRTVQ